MKTVFIKTTLMTAATLALSTLSIASNPLEEALSEYHAAAPSAPVLTTAGLAPEYQDFVTHLLARQAADKEALLQEIFSVRAQVKEATSYGSVSAISEKPSNELDRAGKEAGRIFSDVKKFFKEEKDDEKEPAPTFASTLPDHLQHTLKAPDDFSSTLYAGINPALLEGAPTDGKGRNEYMTWHYVTFGSTEGRAYK